MYWACFGAGHVGLLAMGAIHGAICYHCQALPGDVLSVAVAHP